MTGTARSNNLGIGMDPRTGARPPDKRALIGNHPFFRGLDEGMLDQLVAHSVARKMRKNTVLFRKGDSGTTLYLISAGAVRVSAPSDEGKEAVFNLIIPGEILGEIAFIDGGQRTADAVMIEDGEAIVIERRDFIPILSKHPQLAMRLLSILCARLRRTSEQVEDIVFFDVPMRLAKALLHLHRRSVPGTSIHITQRELSQMIGASRESTNRELRKMQRRKWLKLERAGLLILAPQPLISLVPDNSV